MAPLTETLIFLLAWAAWTATHLKDRWFLLGSAGGFAAYHLIIPGPHVYRVSVAFVAGLFLAAAFLRSSVRLNGVAAYVACALTHSLYNGLIALV